ncbi:hypothetical protein VNO77_23279 [Canavalia gladiata]|uniref:Uncharacterized protein n=1 Tax=Canavalia gladiata TaxID=3824 RepID=A0AAN9QF81_CANGL
MIGSAIGNEGWNQALRGNIRVLKSPQALSFLARILHCIFSKTKKNKDVSIQPILLAQIVIWVDGINLLGSWQANLVCRNSALSSTLGKETKLKA